MDFNGKRERDGGGVKFPSDECEPCLPVPAPSKPAPPEEIALPTIPATLIVRWSTLAGGMLFFVAALILACVIVPALVDFRRSLESDRKALDARERERANFDITTRDAQKWITSQQAEQIQQVRELKRLLDDMRTTNRKD